MLMLIQGNRYDNICLKSCYKKDCKYNKSRDFGKDYIIF